MRADLSSGDARFWVQLTPGQVESLDLTEGSRVWVRPSRGAATIAPSTLSVAPTDAVPAHVG